MRFAPVEDIPGIETSKFNIKIIDEPMHELIHDVRHAVTHHEGLRKRSRELASSLDDLLLQHLYTHKSMRLLLAHAYKKKDYPIVPDSASLAREQVEKIYQAVILLQGPHKWLRQYLRNSWQKDYQEYLLAKDEYGTIERYHEHIHERYPAYLDKIRRLKLKPTDSILVSDFAMKVVEYEWHNNKPNKKLAKPAWFKRQGGINHYIKGYFYFPTPGAVMGKVKNPTLYRFLDRWYQEYRQLSEYSHILSGKITPQRISRNKSQASAAQLQIYSRKKAESFIMTSSIAAASLCTVIMPHIGNGLGSRKTTREYWELLSRFGLTAKGLWKMYAEKTLE